MSKDLELTVKKTIPASRKAVFQAWLDPKALAQFMRPAEGMSVPKVENDPKVGGQFLIVMRAGEQDSEHRGEYKEISEYDKLVFTWESQMSEPGSLVTITFTEKGPNETEVILHHAGSPSEESRNDHEGGWGRIIDTLATHLT
ncbi:MAG: SRPBCC family protein [Polyangiales bacterium]